MTTEQVSTMSTSQFITVTIIYIAICVLFIIAMWKLFTKAGEKGWKSIIPIYNSYIFVKIADGNGWKFLLFIIPFVNIVYAIMLDIRLAKAYGKGVGFGIGLIFLPFIFELILAFGSADYLGPQ